LLFGEGARGGAIRPEPIDRPAPRGEGKGERKTTMRRAILLVAVSRDRIEPGGDRECRLRPT
jgi:hypothetical protein